MSNTVKVSKRLWQFADQIQNPIGNPYPLAEISRTLMYRNDYTPFNYLESDIDKLIKHIDDNLISGRLGEKYVTYFSNGKWTTPICISVNDLKQITLSKLGS